MNFILKIILPAFLIISLFSKCIGDDFVEDTVDPELRILTNIDTLALGSILQLEAMYLNNVGREEKVDVTWSSSDPTVATISANGLISSIAFGLTTIQASYTNEDNVTVTDTHDLVINSNTTEENTDITGTLRTTSSYVLEGSFTLAEDGENLKLSFESDYRASTALPGLYVYLSNNKNSISDALEIGEVTVFSGAHEYTISGVGINEHSYLLYFCKPFNVKVGDAEL